MAETSVKFIQCAVVSDGVLKIDRIGAGVGVILYSPALKKGAGLHILAPRAGSIKPSNPIMYADTAIPHVLSLLEKEGAKPPFSVAIAGGAEMLGREKSSNMGEKVVSSVKEVLKKAGLNVKIDKTGGTQIRSILLDVGAGKIKIT
jgi:chemotaxis protein CheD